MSLLLWKEVFYPKEPTMEMTWAEACEHSIAKWNGLFSPILSKYHISKHQHFLFSDPYQFPIDATTCALCVKAHGAECELCPIVKMRGHSCDIQGDGDQVPEYLVWRHTHNPAPMLRLLKQTLKYIQANPDKFP